MATAVIEGKLYNTETATEICECGSHAGLGPGDFRYWTATLYRTPNGRYFLDGKGGPMSMWARPVGNNSMTGSSGIIPISADDAYDIAESELHADVLMKVFPGKVEDA